MKKLVLAFAAALCLLVTAESAPAQDWPVRLRLFILWSPRSPKTLYLLPLKKLDLDQNAFFDHTTILAS